jgi:tRNA(Ile)-lysidine synthase
VGPAPPIAAVRSAVRSALRDIDRDALVLVACSGGADSLALAAAVAFVAPRAGLRAGAVTVDHGLQVGSGERAGAVAAACRSLGLDPTEAVAVTVGAEGGPEAAARAARRAGLQAAATRYGACAVLLGHTRDDQAETVLLGLARGSGARSLAGMAAVSGPGGLWRRPLLDLPRATLRAACEAAGLSPWDDPHNADPAYARARVRHRALPTLERELGPGVAEALARTAALLRADADALDAWAADVRRGAGLDVATLRNVPPAVRRRVLRAAVVEAGSPAGALTAAHVATLESLVTAWHGQGPIHLPGGVCAARACGRLLVARASADEPATAPEE